MLVGGGSVMGRRSPPDNPVHPLFLDRLEAATAKARAALGNQPFDVGPLPGPGQPARATTRTASRSTSSPLANPYVMNEKDEPDVDAKTAPVYERIATTMLGRSTVITPRQGQGRANRASDRHLRADRGGERRDGRLLLRAQEAGGPGRATAAEERPKPLSPPKSMSGRTFAPEVLAALDVNQVQADYDVLLGIGPKGGTDFPFAGGGPGKPPRPRPRLPDHPQGGRGRVSRREAALGGDGLRRRFRRRHALRRRQPPRRLRALRTRAPHRQAPGRGSGRRRGSRTDRRPNTGARRARAPGDRRRAGGPSGDGTTAELRAERERLERERANLHVSTIEPETERRYNRYTSSSTGSVC